MPEQLTVMLRVLPAVSRHRKTEGTFWHAMFLYVLNNSLTFWEFSCCQEWTCGSRALLEDLHTSKRVRETTCVPSKYQEFPSSWQTSGLVNCLQVSFPKVEYRIPYLTNCKAQVLRQKLWGSININILWPFRTAISSSAAHCFPTYNSPLDSELPCLYTSSCLFP